MKGFVVDFYSQLTPKFINGPSVFYNRTVLCKYKDKNTNFVAI